MTQTSFTLVARACWLTAIMTICCCTCVISRQLQKWYTVVSLCVAVCDLKKAPPPTPTFLGGCKFMTNCNIHRCLFEFQTSLLECLHLLWKRCSLKLFSCQLSLVDLPFTVCVGESCQKWNVWIATVTFTAITLLMSSFLQPVFCSPSMPRCCLVDAGLHLVTGHTVETSVYLSKSLADLEG